MGLRSRRGPGGAGSCSHYLSKSCGWQRTMLLNAHVRRHRQQQLLLHHLLLLLLLLLLQAQRGHGLHHERHRRGCRGCKRGLGCRGR
jgi:hypothetical protein